jgi:hypothetical protein
MLLRTYEQLIVKASLDRAFGAHLLAKPRDAALEAGYSAIVAESLVGLSGASLAEFAASLHRRIYGTEPARDAYEPVERYGPNPAWSQQRAASTA